MPAYGWKPVVQALPYVLRMLAVLVSFALSWYGVLWGYAGAVGLARQATGRGPQDTPPWMLVVALLMAYAWIAWLLLGLSWVVQRRLHPWWPISGTVVGIACIVFTFGFAIAFTFPAIIMAIVFVTFHLSDEARGIEAARRAARASRSAPQAVARVANRHAAWPDPPGPDHEPDHNQQGRRRR